MKPSLSLDGVTHFVGKEGLGYSVTFRVTQIIATVEKPHGLDYSLISQAPNGDRIAAFDNAHAVRGRPKGDLRYDHKHRFKTVRPYDYQDAGTLIEDFYTLIDSVLAELGAQP